MSLYNEIDVSYLSKFYRLEGCESYPYFSTKRENEFVGTGRYIYISGAKKHHIYYANKKLRKLVTQEVLKKLGKNFNGITLNDPEVIQKIINELVELDYEPLISIEFMTSSIFEKLLENNSINSKIKNPSDKRIERVDTTKHRGGYGLTGDWLHLFDILTFAYFYQEINLDDIVEYLKLMRNNYRFSKIKANPSPFLEDDTRRTLVINTNALSNFNKYDVLNTLQRIIEKGLYFDGSILSKHQEKVLRNLVNEYLEERDRFIKDLDTKYKQYIKK